MTTKLTLILLILLICIGGYSQDKIILKNGSEINAWIIEKSDKEIKYKIMDSPDSPVILTKTNKVHNITFRDGQVMRVSSESVRIENPVGINVGLMFGLNVEDANYKIHADYFLNSSFNIDINMLIGAEGGGGMTTGLNYYFNANKPSLISVYFITA